MTTFELAVRGVTRGGLLAALLAVILLACGGTATSSDSLRSAPPASDAPTDQPASTPMALSLDDLAGGLADHDGQVVTVTGYLLISDDRAQLCGVLLESYPPQCGAVAVRVLGEVPADVLDGLDTTTEPDISKAWWGTVRITGLLAAAGSDGAPTITIESIELTDGL